MSIVDANKRKMLAVWDGESSSEDSAAKVKVRDTGSDNIDRRFSPHSREEATLIACARRSVDRSVR